MTTPRVIVVVLFMGSLLTVFGCATSPKHPLTRRPSFSRELRHQLVDILKTRQRQIRDLKGMGTVRYGSRWMGTPGEVALLIESPSHLRVDALSDFGMYDFQLSLLHGRMRILWPGQNRYFEGEASPESLGRYFLLPLSAEEAISLLMGHIYVEEEESYLVRTRLKGEYAVLKGGMSEVVFKRSKNPPQYVPVRYTAFDVDASRKYTVKYEGHIPEEGIPFPHRMTARFFRPGSRLEIDYRDLEVNVGIDKKLFALPIPSQAISISD